MLRYIVFTHSKKYKMLSGYSANAQTRFTFLQHIARKFQQVIEKEDGSKLYKPYFLESELRKAISRGYISVEFVGLAIKKGGETE